MSGFNLADLFELVADTVPEREALVCGTRRLTYAALEERANRLAAALAARGVGPGSHVGLHLYNSTEYIEGMLAAFKLRAVPVNVNYRYVADELRYLFDDADLALVVTEPDLEPVVEQANPGLPRIVRGDDYESVLRRSPAARPEIERSGDDLYVLYTGGTTGLPKGVLWRHEDLFFAALGGGNPGGVPIAHVDEVPDRARRGRTRLLPACPFMHGTAHWVAFSTLFTGGAVIVDPGRGLDAARLLDLADREGATFLVIVGDAFGRPIADAVAAEPDRWDLSSLSVILSGGAILSPTVKATLNDVLPSTIVVDGFGASETGGQGQMVSAAGASPGAHPQFVVGPDTQVFDDDLRPVAPGSGVVGRVARCGHIPLGYHKDRTKTAATFPVIDGVRWSMPGDMATVEPDGRITLLGRGSVSINSGGEKVFPEEVEACLKGHPAVFDAVVVGVPDDRWGQRVTAVVQVRAGHDAPTVAELAAHCRGTLAGYKLPKAVTVVGEVVRSPSGKPDYRWARQLVDDTA